MNRAEFKKKVTEDFEGRRRVYLMGEMTAECYRGLKEMYDAVMKLLTE